MQFTLLDSVADLPSPVWHYDASVFPDNSGWYSIFEQSVALERGVVRLGYCCESTDQVALAGDAWLTKPRISADTDANPNPNPNPNTNTNTRTRTRTDTATETETATETATDTDTDTRTGTGTGTNGVDCLESVLLPLYRSQSALGFKRLTSLDNYYSVDYRPLCSSEKAHQNIAPLLRHVLQTESPHILQLRGVDVNACETSKILHALKLTGWRPYLSVHQVNWTHDLVGSYDDYIDSRPGRTRSTLRRKSAKLMKLPNVQFAVHNGQSDLDQLLEAYQCIYDNSWKVPEPHRHFIPQLISQSAKSGQLRLGLLTVDDIPVAVHFWIVKKQTAYIYKLAHDSAYDHYSPGTLLMAHMVKYVMENDGVNRLDFLSGDDAYKRDWMSVRREKYVVTAFHPRSPIAQALRLKNQHILPFVKQLALFATKLSKWR